MTDCSIAALPGRRLIRVAGEDARDFLQGILTQDLAAVDAAGAGFAAVLTPQGKILFDFMIVPSEGGYLIDVDAEAAPALLKRLKMYRLRAKVDIEPREDLGAAAIFSADGDPGLPECARASAGKTGAVVFTDPRLAALGGRLIAREESLAALQGAFAPASADDYHARRIAFGVPEFGADYGLEDVFLLDVNADALNGVSYRKGCFVGQEVTSRMKRKGEVRRRTLIVDFDEPAPAKGVVVSADEATLGEITSASGAGALALIRLDRWEKAKTGAAALNCDGRDVRLRLPSYLGEG